MLTTVRQSALRIAVTATCLVFAFATARLIPAERDQQTSAREQKTAPPAASAKIAGRILSDTSNPLRKALVTLVCNQPAVSKTVYTDASGGFEIAGLPACSYALSAAKYGHLTLSYGQRRPFERGRPLEVRAGETIEKMTLILPRGSVIAGEVRDEYGDPAAQVTVEAMRYYFRPTGERELRPVGISSATDDRGVFRLFGLMPGTYLVRASANPPGSYTMTVGGATLWSGTSREGVRRESPTYYPGALNASGAEPVTVGLAEERTGIFFSLFSVPSSRIEGSVTDSRGRPASSGTMSLTLRGDDGSADIARTAPISANGTFSISNVAAGEYLATAQINTREGLAEVGDTSISVDGQDQSDVTIATHSGVTIRGAFVVRGSGSPPRLSDLRIVAVPATRITHAPLPGSSDNAIRPDGTFQLSGVTGVRYFRIAGLSSPWQLKSVSLGDDDITDKPLDVRSLRQRDVGLQIVITDQKTEITGSCLGDAKVPTSQCIVVAVPRTEMAGLWLQRFVRAVTADNEGQFRIEGLPADDYILAGVPALEQGAQWDPELQKRIRLLGKPISVSEDKPVRIDLRVTDQY